MRTASRSTWRLRRRLEPIDWPAIRHATTLSRTDVLRTLAHICLFAPVSIPNRRLARAVDPSAPLKFDRAKSL
jgi:hypothetical protein